MKKTDTAQNSYSLLLDACASSDVDSVLEILGEQKNSSVLKFADDKIKHALNIACIYGNAQIAEIIIETEYRPRKLPVLQDNEKALKIGCASGHEDIVRLLIEKSEPISDERAEDIIKNNRSLFPEDVLTKIMNDRNERIRIDTFIKENHKNHTASRGWI